MKDSVVGPCDTRTRLLAISGKYGGEAWNQYGYLISNDTYFEDIQQVFKNKAGNIDRNGVSLFIGQGAVFSLLPHIPTMHPVVADINPAVPAFAALEQSSILRNDRPKSAIADILDAVASARGTERPFTTPGYIKEQLEYEIYNFGSAHWSHDANFEPVREALTRSPIIPVVADVSSRAFALELKRARAPITFANITNLVEYRQLHHGLDSTFLRGLPLAERALVLFSSHKNNRPEDLCPSFRLAEGTQNLYSALDKLDQIPYGKRYYENRLPEEELLFVA